MNDYIMTRYSIKLHVLVHNLIVFYTSNDYSFIGFFIRKKILDFFFTGEAFGVRTSTPSYFNALFLPTKLSSRKLITLFFPGRLMNFY